MTEKIRTYYGHSYRREDREVNKHFWQLFSEEGFAFTVVSRSGTLSIPRLELSLRDSACFVSVVTHREDIVRYRTSPFLVFEYGLARAAGRPRLVFVEERVAAHTFEDVERVDFNREALGEHEDLHRDRIRQLRKRLGVAHATGRRRHRVGLLLPRRDASYRAAHSAIRTVLDEMGYRADDVDYGAPDWHQVVMDAGQYDFLVIDVGGPEVPEWIHAGLFGHVAMIRLVHLKARQRPVTLPRLLLRGAIEQVARTDELAIWWRDLNDLEGQLRREVLRLDVPVGQFRGVVDGMRYFNSLDRALDATVFISNASPDNTFASQLGGRLDDYHVRFFHYRARNTIELGSGWYSGLQAQLNASQLFVPIITRSYWKSEICVQEYKTAHELSKEGRLRIYPYFLEDVREGLAVPEQGRMLKGMSGDEQLAEIVNDIDSYLSSEITPPEVSTKLIPGESIPPVDVAIVTILSEEYEAVLRHLDRHRVVPATTALVNEYGWQFGEIARQADNRLYRVVVGRAGQKGTSAGLMIVSRTIEAFRPSYVALVGIAGGLGPAMHGDVVVSDRIYGYEYGMIKGGEEGGFFPRPDWVYPTDNAVANMAPLMSIDYAGWHDVIDRDEIVTTWPPRIHVGSIASGNKVVEDVSDRSFNRVLDSWGDTLIAVEMEGLGAVEAIKQARDREYVVNFTMIRGISDRPKRRSARSAARAETGVSAKTRERDRWKRAAADAAAAFTVQMIRLAWPRAPRPPTAWAARSTEPQ